jgi:predicted Rossmann fold nucleotide-binding protein DprA/Smf involved in DNA uptake
MNFYKTKLNEIKLALGLEVKMVEATLKDGVTKVETEALESGSKVFVVSESGEKSPAPEGSHELQDGTKITVDAQGTITQVDKPEIKVESEEDKDKKEVKVEAAEEEEDKKEMEKSTSEMEKEEEKEEMKRMVMTCMEAIEDVAREVAMVKEEMASYKSKMEKMSKTPGSTKISTYNNEAPASENPMDARLAGLKTLREEFKKTRKF